MKEHPDVPCVIHAYHRYSDFKTLATTCHATEKLPPGTWTSALASVGLPAGITSLRLTHSPHPLSDQARVPLTTPWCVPVQRTWTRTF